MVETRDWEQREKLGVLAKWVQSLNFARWREFCIWIMVMVALNCYDDKYCVSTIKKDMEGCKKISVRAHACLCENDRVRLARVLESRGGDM